MTKSALPKDQDLPETATGAAGADTRAPAPAGADVPPATEVTSPPTWHVERARAALMRFLQGQFSHPEVRRSLLPYAAACTPLIATSLVAPLWMAWAMGLISALSLYRVTQTLDDTAFAVGLRRGFLAYAMPLNLLLAVWSVALAFMDRSATIASTAFAHACLLYLAIAPTVRNDRRRTTRRVPLRWTFIVAATLVLLVQGLAVLATLPPLRALRDVL